jgi:type II secretory pathway component PulF
MIFTEQLSLLLETGTPLHSSLAALQKQTGNPAMAGVIGGLTECIAEGKTFSAALSQYPEVFPSTYVHLVAAAENGGFLHKVLLELFTMDQRRENLRSTLSSALSYPIFLIFFSIAVVIFVLVVVFPKFADMFARIADELPATTRVLMSTSHFLVNHWLAVSVGTVLALACSYWWSRTGPGVWAIDRFKLEVWPLKDIFIRVYLTRTLRVLSLSLSNGVSVMDALVSCREVVSNHLFRSFVAQIEERVKEGSGFAFAFQQADFLPPTVKQMVATGEETGRLPHVLGRVADLYERELTRKLATFSRMIEPVMLLLMGGVIGLIVSALILPIFKLSRAVG